MSAMIDGICPACGHRGLLSLTRACKVECINDACTMPNLVQGLLDKADQHVHLIRFEEDGFTVQHPLAERVAPESLFACTLHRDLRALSGPPGIGMFRIPVGGNLADMEQVDEADVDFHVGPPPSAEVDAEERRQVANAVPLGSVMSIPADQPIPDGWIVPERENRLLAADHPDLAAALRERGYEPMLIDGEEYVAIDLPAEAMEPSEGLCYVLHVK